MYNVYFDSGTSNSRVYLLDESLKTVLTAKKAVGSKDSALMGSNLVLINALKELYDSVLEQAGVEDAQVKGIYASGMVTSPYGLCEMPHLVTPLPLVQLANNMHVHRETRRFGRDIHLIRGVRTGGVQNEIDQDNIEYVNNMRGEEIELLGVMSVLADVLVDDLTDGLANEACIVVNPGSHTHSSYIRKGILEDIFSTFSGELYHAIVTETILAGAIDDNVSLDFEAASKGYLALEKYGINRALYICHSQRVFGVGTPTSRQSFLEGVISGGIITCIRDLCHGEWKEASKIIVVQSGNVSKILVNFLKSTIPEIDVLELNPGSFDSFALLGFREILRMISHES